MFYSHAILVILFEIIEDVGKCLVSFESAGNSEWVAEFFQLL